MPCGNEQAGRDSAGPPGVPGVIVRLRSAARARDRVLLEQHDDRRRVGHVTHVFAGALVTCRALLALPSLAQKSSPAKETRREP